MLVRAKKLSSSQRDESLELSKQGNKMHGEALLELGLIYPKNLFLELTNQVREIVLSTLIWEEGVYLFREGPLSPGTVRLKLDMEGLLLEGLKRTKIKRKDDDNFIIQDANKILKNIDNLSYYEVLGIGMNSSPSEIKKAYLKMVNMYHPDRFRYLSDPDIDNIFETLFSVISTAYRTLSSETEKADYDSVLLKGKARRDSRRESSFVAKQFQLGIAEYNRGNFWRASEYFRWVTRQNPEKGNYWYYLSLSLDKIPRKKKEAEQTVLKAIELEPQNANYYVHLGRIYLQGGMKHRAAHQFMTALKWDPTNEKSLSELKKLKEMKE
jgi:curved DNA-binding protein CbpA